MYYQADKNEVKTIPHPATITPFKDALIIENHELKHSLKWAQAFWTEMVLTAFFVSVILSAKYLNGAKDLFLNALVVGLSLFTCICVGGSVSGGCFNPAVGLI